MFRALPQPPELWPGAGLYLESFWKLSTTRSYGFGEGPIPLTAILYYGRTLGFQGEDLLDFEELISSMDRAYLTTKHEKSKETTKPAEKPPG